MNAFLQSLLYWIPSCDVKCYVWQQLSSEVGKIYHWFTFLFHPPDIARISQTSATSVIPRAHTRDRLLEPLNPTEPQVGEEETVDNGPTESRTTDSKKESDRKTARPTNTNGVKPRHIPPQPHIQSGANHREGSSEHLSPNARRHPS